MRRRQFGPIVPLGIWLALVATAGYAQGLRDQFDAFDFTARLGKGINFGNTLEAPNEGDWGFVIQPWQFEEIARAGFNSVRIPIKFSGHASSRAPYTINESFLRRIDTVLEQARSRGLAVIVDMHHYDEIHVDPAANVDRFQGMWRQIAERYADLPVSSVYFELLNEPNNQLTSEAWNQIFVETLPIIRESNPDRMVIVGPTQWNSVRRLSSLELPEADRNLIGTFHFYEPFEFTHQGAEWIDGSNAWLGTTWTGTPAEEAYVRGLMGNATRWSDRNDRPVLMGEFGAYSTADMDSRARWTEYVREQAESRGFAMEYWEFGAGFGVYDRQARQWREPLLNALAPRNFFDVDGDSEVHIGDLDFLSSSVAQGSTDATFDLNNDGVVTQKDAYFWVYFTENLLGDVNLDRTVNLADFGLLRSHFGRPGAWSDGDLDIDGAIGLADFNLLKESFGAPAAPVPEASTWTLAMLGGMALLASRVRNERSR